MLVTQKVTETPPRAVPVVDSETRPLPLVTPDTPDSVMSPVKFPVTVAPDSALPRS